MRTLDRMLFSDLLKMWRQGIAISLLLACGIATFVMSTSAMQSLDRSREFYYSEYRFADVFASLTRAPNEIANRLKKIDGVAQVQNRIVQSVLLDMSDMIEPASCQLVSIDNEPSHGLNRIFLRQGRLPISAGRNEVIASESFAKAHNLRPGALLNVTMDGRKETIRIVGIGLSPEYIYAVQPGLLLTDNRRFGVLWMPRRQMEAAFNMEGAFNSVTIAMQPKASTAEVIYQMDRILKPYGGHGAFTRHDQESNRRLMDEMHQMRSMAYVTPFIFLSVASFLFNIVLTRLVHQQREQIASLRAFGYTRFEIALHYFKFLLILVVIGSILGCVIGWRMSRWMTDMYTVFFRFPVLHREFAIREALIAISIGFIAAIAGGFSALVRVVRMEPAVAMRPEPPQAFGGSILDRMGLAWSVSPLLRMILRRLEANRRATILSVLGVAMGLAILVLGSFMRDTIAFVLDSQFGRSQRQDVMLTFNEPLSSNAFHDALHLPGVLCAEPFRTVPIRLKHGARQYRLGLMGLIESPSLYRVLDSQLHPIRLPERQGLTITKKLAELLDVRLGDELIVEVLENDRSPVSLPITAVFANYTDPAAYLNRLDLHRLMGESERLSGVFLSVDALEMNNLYAAVKKTPSVAGVLDNNAARKNFQDMIQENTRLMRLFNSVFGALIAFGVIYNAALITLAESGRDLATLRVIGFSRPEVATILLGELAIITLLAIPVGIPIGYFFSYLATLAIDTETHRFPLVIARDTYAYATSTILLSAFFSAWMVRRMLNKLDLLSVLKVKVS
jgi:putative ABC transport system permease protein